MAGPKRQRLTYFHKQKLPVDDVDSSPDDDDDDSEVEEESAPERQQLKRTQNDNVDDDVKRIETDEEIERSFPFCCAVCHCSPKRKTKLIFDAYNDEYIPCDGVFLSCNTDHFHRLCCHGGMQVQANDSIDFTEKKSVDVYVTAVEANESIEKGNRLESGYFNMGDLPLPGSLLMTNDSYAEEVMKRFQIQTECKRKEGLVVLDLFGGTGTALVVLKRLNIPIKKVIHVEHDQVATFVTRMNHDFAFVESLRQFAKQKRAKNMGPDCNFDGGYARLSKWKISDDGIEHVYYDRFEDIFDSSDDKVFRAFAVKHIQNGGIDLITGGPPCVDYSRVNAKREGTKGKYGEYMLLTGKLFQSIKREQKARDLHVMIENVVISDREDYEKERISTKTGKALKRKDSSAGNDLHETRNESLENEMPSELSKISAAFGFKWDPIEIDAWEFSPGRRRRHFFTNIPYSDPSEEERGCIASLKSCLDDDYVPAQMLPFQDGDDTEERRIKAHTFMASKGRLEDTRMQIFKVHPSKKGRYLMRCYNVAERERIMGYPEGYVSEPVSMLFDLLYCQGYALCNKYSCEKEGQDAETWPLEKDWREMLPPELHCFAGNFLGRPFKKRCNAFQFRKGMSTFNQACPATKQKGVTGTASTVAL